MITRAYFVTYKTGNENGHQKEGFFTLTSKSWFAQQKNVENKAVEFIESKKLPNGFVITQFYRVF